MAGEDTEGLGAHDGARHPVVFVTEVQGEAERIAAVLRNTGYSVTDVTQASFVTRAQLELPSVIVLDVDTPGALDEVARLRRLPGTGAIDVVFVGNGEGAVQTSTDAIAHEGSAFFARPVDLAALERRVHALTGGPVPALGAPTPSPPPARIGVLSVDRPLAPMSSQRAVRGTAPPLPMSTTSLADLVEPPRSLPALATVSEELKRLLVEAEMRVEGTDSSEAAALPTPEEEIESVLAADVLASLDEPLEGDEENEGVFPAGGGTGNEREATGGIGKPTTASGMKSTTASGRTQPPKPVAIDRGTNPDYGFRTPSDVPHEPEFPRMTSAPPTAKFEPPRRLDSIVPIESLTPSAGPVQSASEAPLPSMANQVVLRHALEARRFLADAVAKRWSGSLAFEHERVVRRIVVREGDFVTAASGAEHESLVAFLGARGELPKDEVERIVSKTPPYGRHAGAALVAHGWLAQEQLWAVLRAHAEWIASVVCQLDGGTALLETEPPGRLRNEPSVFGAATGAEVFVELVRRAVSTPLAIDALGGDGARLSQGPRHALLAECALSAIELDLLARASGATVNDVIARAPDTEMASVLHALVLLGVLDVLPAIGESSRRARVARHADAAALDDEAFRARVRARLELVEEGDYFAVLGVPHHATSYEIRRAFLELRRVFEPSNVVSPSLADIAVDVRTIVSVLEEAYEVLRDPVRRERYRRAIDAAPA